MKIGSKLQFIVPDSCLSDCPYRKEPFYQGNMCCSCPVFNCSSFGDKNSRLLEPEEYRDDWAEEWEKFFRTGKAPALKIEIKNEK